MRSLAPLALLLLAPLPARAVSIEAARRAVVHDTMAYLNVPYLWGGQHPVTGMDCSAFVRQVYGDAGFSLPRVSRDQYAATSYLKPNQVQPGDLVFFAMKNPGTAKVDHVGIYVGRGYFVAASTTNGVHINAIREPYYWARVVSIRKYRGF